MFTLPMCVSNINNVSARTPVDDTSVSTSAVKKDAENATVCVTPKQEEAVALIKSASDSRNFNGFKNVIEHPFKVLFSGAKGAVLGFLSSLITLGIIPPWISVPVGTICGMLSKIIALYEQGAK